MKKYSSLEVIRADVEGFNGIRSLGFAFILEILLLGAFLKLANWIFATFTDTGIQLGRFEFILALSVSGFFVIRRVYIQKLDLLLQK